MLLEAGQGEQSQQNGQVSKMVDDEETQDKIFEELDMYQIQQDNFGSEIATRQRKNKNFNPGEVAESLHLLFMLSHHFENALPHSIQ